MQEWVSEAFLQSRHGHTALVTPVKLWWYPPAPPAAPRQPPSSPALYFARPLFLWFPYHFWHCALLCPRPECSRLGRKLAGAGFYKTVRRVLDIDGYYYVATEYLECNNCHTKVAAWSKEVLGQLDRCLQLQFPAILTYKLACDKKVVKLLREKTVGRSVKDLLRYLSEQHHQAWMSRCLHYLTACSFSSTSTSTSTSTSIFASTYTSTSASTSTSSLCSSGHHPVLPPPPMIPLPSVEWLSTFIGVQDEFEHLPGALNRLSQRLLKRKLVVGAEHSSDGPGCGSCPKCPQPAAPDGMSPTL
ncbi:uncharacterized protein LOC125299563 isoform X2 [Alosa alosa]|nr:uncharacterized protein LOC125299563 isoform X2 [Alosa alosa]